MARISEKLGEGPHTANADSGQSLITFLTEVILPDMTFPYDI